MKSLIIKLLLIICLVSITQIKSTNSFYSDTEKSTGNTITAGNWGPAIQPELTSTFNNFMLNEPEALIPSQEPETTITPTPGETLEPTSTPEPTLTPTPTSTPAPTDTPIIEDQALIPSPTPTLAPTPIPTPSQTPAPTVTIVPTDIVDGGSGGEE
jgi:predicted ribosomally synthesized peptide with SipW-like signal peptide